jgi:hypothetical protein
MLTSSRHKTSHDRGRFELLERLDQTLMEISGSVGRDAQTPADHVQHVHRNLPGVASSANVADLSGASQFARSTRARRRTRPGGS